MNNNSKKAIQFIENGNYQDFNKLLLTTTDIDYEIIDRELLIKRDFNMQFKIEYCDRFKRDKLLELIEEDFNNNYLYYSYTNILLYTLSKIKSKNKRLSYILKSFIMTPNDQLDTFRRTLENYNYYEEFIKYIKFSNSNYLKVRASIFLGDKVNNELFGSYKVLINYVKKSDLGNKEKIEYLIELSKKIKDRESLAEIEDLIIQYSDIYNEKLNAELANMDQELVEINRSNQEEYIRTVLSVLRDKNDGRSYLYK